MSVAEAEPATSALAAASETPQATPDKPPKSVTHFGLNTIALVIVLVTMYLLRHYPKLARDPVGTLCAAVAVPVVLLDVMVLKVHRRATTGLDWDKAFTPSLERVILKVAGLVMTLAPFALAYWVFPEYNGKFYDPFYNLLSRFWPGLTASSILYITVVDGHLLEPKDTYYKLGRLLTGKTDGTDVGAVKNHYLGWLVKAFFFPLMFVWLNNSTNNVVHYDLSIAAWTNLKAYDFLYDFIFFIDLLFTTVGYALCFRPIDTHLRSAEPTFLGWGVALFCYEPFFGMLFERQYVHYQGLGFGNWLAPYQGLRWAWGITILLLITVYVLATVAFGIRFSNLTHRGVLTNGPYRYTKHPAYVSKNLSWWLLSVPFIANESVAISIKHCCGLLLVNFMYYMRAKTEERHLSLDPTYVAYSAWMDEHGWLRWMKRVPLLKYFVNWKMSWKPAVAPLSNFVPDVPAVDVAAATAPSAE